MKRKVLIIATALALTAAAVDRAVAVPVNEHNGNRIVHPPVVNTPQALPAINGAGATQNEIDLKDPGPLVRSNADFVFYILDPPNSVYSEARSINESGDIVGYYRELFNSGISGFLLHENSYTPITIKGATNVFPMRIANDGTIVGAATGNDGRFHGIAIQNGQYEVIDAPNVTNTILTGINNKNEIVGYSFDSPDNVVSFTGRLDDGALQPLTADNYVWDLNDRDDMVGHTKTPDTTPVDNTDGRPLALIVADKVASTFAVGGTTKAYGINDNGDVVGTWSEPHGFLLHDGQAVTFDVPGSEGKVGTAAYGVNNADWIVGVFQQHTQDSRGEVLHGFLAVPKTGNYTQIQPYSVEAVGAIPQP